MATTPVAAIVSGQVTDFDMVREALASEYEVLEELGRGGMALVYRAKDRQLEREVAIKVLPFSLAFDAEFVERFQREARTSAQLEHPNIIPIYRVGRSGRVIYFVMKYLRGGALSNILGTRRLSPPEIRRMLVEAGGALGYAAQRGIVHRDIKPDNIMFDEFGHCVLTDFGIAKAASGQKLTGTGMSIGTPHYMSPEQARAQTIDGRSDIYSLGIVAYQCLTGVVPYDGEDSFSIGYKHITEPVPAPHLTTADERRLYDVIRRMLMKDPSDRFQDCEDLIAALHGQPIAPVGAFRNRASAIAAAPAAVAVPAGLAPALGGGGGGGGVAIASGPSGAPAFASQPTTPIASPTVDRRKQPIGRRASPRRVADRSLALRNDGNSKAWIWILIAVVAGAAAALYYYKSHGFASGEALKSAPSAVAADSLHRSDTLTAGLPAKRDTTRSAGPSAASVADSTLAVPSAPPASSAPAAPGDSGALRISGIPARSEVLIDERPATSAVTRLPVGRHVIAISAPLRNFYVDTVEIRAGETMELTPELTALGTGTPGAAPPGSRLERRQAIREARREAAASGSFSCEPAVNYNAARCFDVRPQPRTATFVPVPAGATGTPTPSVLWVKVSAAGTTEEVRRLRPSSDPVFERAVRQYVETLTWDPAKKDGAAVDAWTQWIFRPAE